MKKTRMILKLHHESGLSIRQISRALSIARSTVSDYILRFESIDITLEELIGEGVSDDEVYRRLFPEYHSERRSRKKELPDFTWIHNELKK